jgi:hypothetical protein
MEDQGRLLKELRKATNCLMFMDLAKDAEDGAVVVKGQAYKVGRCVATTHVLCIYIRTYIRV